MTDAKAHRKPSTKRIAIVDADSIIFSVAATSEMRVAGATPEEDTWLATVSEDDAYREVCDKIDALIGDAACEEAIICLSSRKKCFRYDLLPTYKANRKGGRSPQYRQMLTDRLATDEDAYYRILRVEGLEADDVCGIAADSIRAAPLREPVVISIDKDLLQIPGWNYNPGVHGNNYAARLTYVTEEDAFRAHLYQTLVGDSTDGYTGIPGWGPKRATKLLDACAHLSPAQQWQWVVEAFRKKGLDAETALVQARVARILRAENWDVETKEVRLWDPPQVEACEGADKHDEEGVAAHG